MLLRSVEGTLFEYWMPVNCLMFEGGGQTFHLVINILDGSIKEIPQTELLRWKVYRPSKARRLLD